MTSDNFKICEFSEEHQIIITSFKWLRCHCPFINTFEIELTIQKVKILASSCTYIIFSVITYVKLYVESNLIDYSN